MKNYTLLIIIIFLTLTLVPSCREECGYKPESFAGIDFHSVIDGADRVAPADSLSVYGVERNILLYSLRRNISQIELPLNHSAAESGFVMVFGETTDTVWISHNVVPVFLSVECGFVLNYELLGTRHTSTMIDSVVIVNNEITSFNDTNIRIYH